MVGWLVGWRNVCIAYQYSEAGGGIITWLTKLLLGGLGAPHVLGLLQRMA